MPAGWRGKQQPAGQTAITLSWSATAMLQLYTCSSVPPQAANIDYPLSGEAVWIYVIGSCSLLGPFKIGISQRPWWRIRDLQVGNPERLQIAFMMPLLDRQDALFYESSFHRIQARNRLEGEWFLLTFNEVMQTLKEINYGQICACGLQEFVQ
jgi:hypothetical protein